jgi:asparagine synthetase B (glutamine-hydrolysing)
LIEVTQQAEGERLVFESDWLGSRPFFYNEKTGAASSDINEVIDLVELEFDSEGFNDFLDFGFCVFGRTPVRNVRMLPHSSRLYCGPHGLRVERLADPAYEWLERSTSAEEVLELIAERVNGAARAAVGDIVVPTSGGFDSRLLNLLIDDRRRIRSFTYGLTDTPASSTEAVKARELARRLGLRWELVPLGAFHRYLDDWDRLFGVSTHAHGMYHIEFYRHVVPRVASGSLLLTGACGEWFSGDDPEVRVMETLMSPDDVLEVFRYGRMCGDSRMSNFRSRRDGAWELLETAPRIRTEMLPRVFTVVRMRMVLLSYLMRVPEALGLQPRAPFLDIDVAMRLLTLPPRQRHQRSWEHGYFTRRGVDLESQPLPSDPRNLLNYRGMRKVPLKPLDVTVLREVVRPDYVEWINRNIGMLGLPYEAMYRLTYRRGWGRGVQLLWALGIDDQRAPAYGAYLTLRPIETLLKRRDRVRAEGGP